MIPNLQETEFSPAQVKQAIDAGLLIPPLSARQGEGIPVSHGDDIYSSDALSAALSEKLNEPLDKIFFDEG